MTDRDGYQPGVPCWVDTWQSDPEATVSFYTQLFGWEAQRTWRRDSLDEYFIFRLRGRDVAGVGTQPREVAPALPAWGTYIWVENADETANKVRAAGGRILMEPFDSVDHGRTAVVADPAGAAFSLWQPGARKGAQLVNEPGAWSMSQLNTNDPDTARTFYAAVFGWEIEIFDLAGAQLTMWKLPGYVGGEPQQPVARDVIATMGTPDSDPADPAPHWSVDFWIGQLDEALSKATNLGGKVTGGSHDIPDIGMRHATIVDPQGATLSLTQPPGVR